MSDIETPDLGWCIRVRYVSTDRRALGASLRNSNYQKAPNSLIQCQKYTIHKDSSRKLLLKDQTRMCIQKTQHSQTLIQP